MLQSMLRQPVFGRDIILNTPLIYNWGAMKKLKQQIRDKDNQFFF